MNSTSSFSTPKDADHSTHDSSCFPAGSDMTATALRTHRCGSLSRATVGTTVSLGGWVHRVSDLGGVIFIELRDRVDIFQLSFNPVCTPPEVRARGRDGGRRRAAGG